VGWEEEVSHCIRSYNGSYVMKFYIQYKIGVELIGMPPRLSTLSTFPQAPTIFGDGNMYNIYLILIRK
jgi:hypothetical protein